MNTRRKVVRITAVCAVLLCLALSAHAGPPKGVDYRIEITSDREVYLEGMDAVFTVTVSKWKDEKELPFNIQGKYLIAFFPTDDTQVVVKDEGNKTWTYTTTLQGTGDMTLYVELSNAARLAQEKSIQPIQE